MGDHLSRLTNGESIPQVGIQPFASPIQTNVLPAPGQQLQGNSLQQLAESLSVFNSGLMAYGQAKVTQQNRMEDERGGSLDFSEVFARGDHLNKSFKQIIADMGLPDSANPYFLAAAERNFGTFAAMKVRNGVLSRMAELSNPELDSAQQAGLLNQIIAEESERWGSKRFKGNFYATNAFNESVASFFPEIERQANEQYLRNKETQALGDFESAITEMLAIGKLDASGSDQFSRQMVAEMTDIQRFTTDPEKIRSAIFRSVVTAFQGAANEEEINNIMSAALDLPYGQGKTVADNMGLYAQLAAARSRAEDGIERKADQEDRRFRRSFAAASRQAGEAGFIQSILPVIQGGGDVVGALQKWTEDFRAKNPDIPPAVMDALYEDQFSTIAKLSQNQNAISSQGDTDDANWLMGQIVKGNITLDQVVDFATERGLDAARFVPVFEAAQAGQGRVKGKVQQAAILLTTQLAKEAEELGVRFDPLDRNQAIDSEVTQALVGFFEGTETFEGKTYKDYEKEGRANAATAGERFINAKLQEIRKRVQEQLKNDAAGASLRNEALAGLEATALFDAQTPDQIETAVEAQVATFEESYKGVLSAFTDSSLSGLERVTYSGPRAVSQRLASLLSLEGPFDVKVPITPPKRSIFGGQTIAATRRVVSDGSTVRVFAAGEVIAQFTRQQLRDQAVNIRMSQLGGISVDDVLNNRTGVPGVTLDDYVRQVGKFRWDRIPVFADRKEFGEFVSAAQRGQFTPDQQRFLRTVLGVEALQNMDTVRNFMAFQARMIEGRETYQGLTK